MEASRGNVSELGIIDLRNRYFEDEYQNDQVELIKRKKLCKIEPFPTVKVIDVMNMLGVPEVDKLRKLYFSTWLCTLSDAQVVYMNEAALSADLDKFIAGKSIAPPVPAPINTGANLN